MAKQVGISKWKLKQIESDRCLFVDHYDRFCQIFEVDSIDKVGE